jgi:hypothetical protein
MMLEGKIDTWDYQWCISSMINGLSIVPCQSLVENVGFGEDASHTKSNSKYKSHLNAAPFVLRDNVPKGEYLQLDYEYLNDIFEKFCRFQKWI